VKTGRRSLKDEKKIFERYSELSGPYFRVLRDRLDSKFKREQDWAVEQLTKAFVKMIPTEGTGKDGKDLFPVPILNGMNERDSVTLKYLSPAVVEC
jgi:hypothetical protein